MSRAAAHLCVLCLFCQADYAITKPACMFYVVKNAMNTSSFNY